MASQNENPVAAPVPADKPVPEERPGEDALDAALEKTFPASDPTAVGRIERRAPKGRDVDRKPLPIDQALVDRLAEQVKAGRK